MKLVINQDYGGFSLSPKAALWLYEHGWKDLATPVKSYFGGEGVFAERHPRYDWEKEYQKSLMEWRAYQEESKNGEPNTLFVTVFTPDEQCVLDQRPDNRANPLLVECVETMGTEAEGSCASLKVIEIPDGVEYEIDEYDGVESVHEKHRSWS